MLTSQRGERDLGQMLLYLKHSFRKQTVILTQCSHHPQFTDKCESHADSDGDPPLIPISHHISSNDEAMGEDEIDIDNLPFVRLSQRNVTYNKKVSDDVYTSEKC